MPGNNYWRTNLGPLYFCIDLNAFSLGAWVYVDPDQSVAVELSILCFVLGLNLFDPVEEEEEA